MVVRPHQTVNDYVYYAKECNQPHAAPNASAGATRGLSSMATRELARNEQRDEDECSSDEIQISEKRRVDSVKVLKAVVPDHDENQHPLQPVKRGFASCRHVSTNTHDSSSDCTGELELLPGIDPRAVDGQGRARIAGFDSH